MTRGFAYNPNQEEITGTVNVASMCVGIDPNLDYSTAPGGLTWYMGPSETGACVIARPFDSNELPLELQEAGAIRFWVCVPNDFYFIDLVSLISSTSQESKESALSWLAANDYWTNYELNV